MLKGWALSALSGHVSPMRSPVSEALVRSIFQFVFGVLGVGFLCFRLLELSPSAGFDFLPYGGRRRGGII